MKKPNYQTMMLPILNLVKDEKHHSNKEIIHKIAEFFKLSEDDRRRYGKDGKETNFGKSFGWSKTYLKKAGLIVYPQRGYIHITKRGLQVLEKNPLDINVKYLLQFEEFLDFKYGNKRDLEDKTETDEESKEQTPSDTIEGAYLQLRSVLIDELIEVIKSKPPEFFERLVVELLEKMGYGNFIEGAGQVTGKSGDGGIDGTVFQDKLELEVVYIQTKKWEAKVGLDPIRNFAGALVKQQSKKGVFFTTSSFTPRAKKFVEGIDQKIALIDGEQLAELMIDYNLGVTKTKNYDIKQIDSDYFIEE